MISALFSENSQFFARKERPMKRIIVFPALTTFLCSLALASVLHAATYEVAQQNPQASDDAPGTAERPWKTITRAAEKAGPGDVVVIRGGVYRERVVVKTSGTAEAPIRFEAAPGEQVVVTGADRLTGWQKADEARPILPACPGRTSSSAGTGA